MVRLLPFMPRFFVGWVAKRYVAGKDISSAVASMQKLAKSEGCRFTVDVLGEDISTLEEAEYFLAEYERIIAAITENGLDANISVKPTAFGLLIDEGRALSNMERLLTVAKQHDMFVRLDMEDHRVTQATIDVFTTMQAKGFDNVGIVLQARLFRTAEDISQICGLLNGSADFRICKGIYLESEKIAHTDYHGINSAFTEALEAVLDRGAYCAIATHDKPVVNSAIQLLTSRGMGPSIHDPREGVIRRGDKSEGYEFQMLLGVRGDLRRQLLKQGHNVRVYIPYGTKWYEYSMRRLRENPDVAWHITKSFLMPWSR